MDGCGQQGGRGGGARTVGARWRDGWVGEEEDGLWTAGLGGGLWTRVERGGQGGERGRRVNGSQDSLQTAGG